MEELRELKIKNKRAFRRKVQGLLEDYERIINNTDSQYREYMRRECDGSIRCLREVIASINWDE